MSAEAAKFANGPVMWIISLLTVGLVAFQAVLIYRLTKKYAEAKKALTPEEMQIALKTEERQCLSTATAEGTYFVYRCLLPEGGYRDEANAEMLSEFMSLPHL